MRFALRYVGTKDNWEVVAVEKVKEWLLLNGTELAVKAVAALIVIFIGWLVIKAMERALRRTLDKSERLSELLKNFIIGVSNRVLWLILIMVALQRIGINVAPLIAGLGVTGFIVGFAFQESLANLAAGFMIALNRPFTEGDLIDAAGVNGVVETMNMMAVTLVTADNKKVIAPNRSIWGAAITNYTALDTRRVDTTIGIAYGESISQAQETIQQALSGLEVVQADPAPTVEVVELADSSVNLVVRPWCRTADYWEAFFQVNRTVKDALDHADIEIPFPQRDVHFHGAPPAPSPQHN